MEQAKRLSFLRKVKINQDRFDQVGLTWDELEAISKDYIKREVDLRKAGEYIANDLMAVQNVHSVRFRTKDPEHLIIKIIRKRHEKPDRKISLENYLVEITDLIGVRAIHLLKNQWQPINKFILDKWDLREQQIAYIRAGDSESYLTMFAEAGFQIQTHDFGYRSLHYIITTQPAKEKYFAEIQLRTIFEEGWSEIDHKVRYPNSTDNSLYNEFLSILNRLAGSADEMGTFIINLKNVQFEQKMEFKEALLEKDLKIRELEQRIGALDINKDEKADIFKILNSIEDSKPSKFANLLEPSFPIGSSLTPLSDVLSEFLKPIKAIEKKKTPLLDGYLAFKAKSDKKNDDK